MLTTVFKQLCRAWGDALRELTDPYRPERHYMRGPGPKWRALHKER